MRSTVAPISRSLHDFQAKKYEFKSLSLFRYHCCSSACVQLLERSIPDPELYIARNLGVFISTTIIIRIKRISVIVPNKADVPVLVLAICLCATSAYFYYAAINYLPLITTDALSITVSLVSGMVLYKVWLHEEITGSKILSIVLASIGIVAILQPDFRHLVLKANRTSEENNVSSTSLGNAPADRGEPPITVWDKLVFGYLFVLINGIISATKYLSYKMVTRRDIDTFIPVFWGNLSAFVISFVSLLVTKSFVRPKTLKQVLLILGHAGFTALRSASMILQVNLLDANESNILLASFCALVTLLYQYTFLQHILPAHRNFVEILGVCLVVCGAVLTSVVMLWKTKQDASTEKGHQQNQQCSPDEMTK